MKPSPFAQEFAAGLTEKFKDAGPYASNQFSVMPGRKYDRIVQRSNVSHSGSVHAFVERTTGHVLKAAGWQTPAPHVRFNHVQDALAEADLHGGYLYMKG